LDTLTGEYQFNYREQLGEHDGPAVLVIYHCPFCGGAAPTSRRERLFAVIAKDEEERLCKVMNGIKSLDDAVRKLGPPDDNMPSGLTQRIPEKSGNPPVIRHFRTLVYSRLSETAELRITDYHEQRISFSLQGKYVGPPSTGSEN
jgi:hypothetical protein